MAGTGHVDGPGAGLAGHAGNSLSLQPLQMNTSAKSNLLESVLSVTIWQTRTRAVATVVV